MKLSGIGLVLRKELLETVRDRRTLIMILVVPLVLYPAVFVLLEQLALTGLQQVTSSPARVGLRGHIPDGLPEYLAGRDDIVVVDAAVANANPIRWTALDAVVIVDTLVLRQPARARVTIAFDGSSDRSLRGRTVAERAMRAWGDTVVSRRLRDLGLPPTFTEPLVLRERWVAPRARATASVAGRVLPLLLVLITLLGAFYPAIDLSAGEKERGTLESLLMTPTPPWVVLTGKFITVAAVGFTSAAVNLASILFTVRIGLFSLPAQLGIDTSLSPLSLFFAFLTLVPLAVLFAGLFLGIAVRAHSFKEAQNALTPVYVLVLIPALLPAIPGIDLTPTLAAAPVAGVTLLLRDLLVGRTAPLTTAIVLGTTALYATVALWFAARSFGAEQVLFGRDDATERRGLFRSLFSAREDAQALPTLGEATVFMAVVAALYFYGGRTMLYVLGADHARVGIMISQWLLLLLPALLFIRVMGFRFREILGLRRPSARATAGALLLAVGAVPVGIFFAWLQSRWFALPEDVIEMLRHLLIPTTAREALLVALTAAITPAICEEVVFRGVFLSSTRRLHYAAGIALSAAVFGLFHVSYESAIRFLPTAWLGLVLGWTVWWTRSLWLAALMHAVHNGLLLVLASAGSRIPSVDVRSIWGVSVFAAGVLLVLVGGRLVLGMSGLARRTRAGASGRTREAGAEAV